MILAIIFVGTWVSSLFYVDSFLVDLPIGLLLGIPYAAGIPLLFLIIDFHENVGTARYIKTSLWLVYRARYELDWSISKIEFLDEEFEEYFNRELEIRRMRQIHKSEE